MAKVKEAMQKLQPKEQMKEAVREVIQEQQQQSSGQEQDAEQKKTMKCITDCSNARIVCLQTERYGLTNDDRMADAELMSALHDCVDLCEATENALIRESSLVGEIAKLCQKACQETVKISEQFKDDQQIKTLSQYLNQCAESCDEV